MNIFQLHVKYYYIFELVCFYFQKNRNFKMYSITNNTNNGIVNEN